MEKAKNLECCMKQIYFPPLKFVRYILSELLVKRHRVGDQIQPPIQRPTNIWDVSPLLNNETGLFIIEIKKNHM